MGYRKKTTSSAIFWINDLESIEKTVYMKLADNGIYTFAEGTVTGGTSITESEFNTDTAAVVGDDTEMAGFLRVGQRPAHAP